jgi:hypothetical protein
MLWREFKGWGLRFVLGGGLLNKCYNQCIEII